MLPFSSVCKTVNSLCPTFHKYILSVLRLSVEAILGVGSGFVTLPFSSINSTSSGRSDVVEVPYWIILIYFIRESRHIVPLCNILRIVWSHQSDHNPNYSVLHNSSWNYMPSWFLWNATPLSVLIVPFFLPRQTRHIVTKLEFQNVLWNSRNSTNSRVL